MFRFAKTRLAHQHRESRDKLWRSVYEQCHFDDLGVSLQDFLDQPWDILVKHGQETALMAMRSGYRPLLPRQAEVAMHIRSLDMRLARFPRRFSFPFS